MQFIKDGSWLNEPEQWIDGDTELCVNVTTVCDFFFAPDGTHTDNAHLLSAPVVGDFTASVCVDPELKNSFDAGGLMVRNANDMWGKVGVELSPFGETSVVSVVTKGGHSDDNNNELVDRIPHYVRITRKGDEFGFHHSADGRRWRFVRRFVLRLPEEASVGVFAQAPRVQGCVVRFSDFRLSGVPVADFRSGA